MLLLVLPGLLTACAGQTTPTVAPTSQAKVAPANPGAASNLAAAATLPNAAQQRQIAQGLNDLPMSFETNSGQSAANIKFLARGHGYTLALAGDGTATLSLQRATPEADPSLDPTAATPPAQNVQLKLVGANSQPAVTGQELQATKTNYFLGNDPTKWLHDLSNYSRVQYDRGVAGDRPGLLRSASAIRIRFCGCAPRRYQFNRDTICRGKKHRTGDGYGRFDFATGRWRVY